MTPADLLAFIARFGEPEDHTLKEFTLPGFPNIFILSNKVVDGKPIGAHNDGVGWHTDYSYKAEAGDVHHALWRGDPAGKAPTPCWPTAWPPGTPSPPSGRLS